MYAYPTPGKLPKNNVFTELLEMSLVAIILFLVLFLLAVLSRQSLLIFIHIPLLFDAAFCLAGFISRSVFALVIAAMGVFVSMACEFVAMVLKLATIFFFCGSHNGCLESFIPYVISAGFSLGVGLFLMIWFFELLKAISYDRAWNKINTQKQEKSKPKVEMTEEQILDEIQYQLTGEWPVPFDEDRLANEITSKTTKSKGLVNWAVAVLKRPKYKNKTHVY